MPTGFNWNLWGHAFFIYIFIGLTLSWIGFMTKHTKNYTRVRNPSWRFETALIMMWPILALMEYFRRHKEDE